MQPKNWPALPAHVILPSPKGILSARDDRGGYATSVVFVWGVVYTTCQKYAMIHMTHRKEQVQ